MYRPCRIATVRAKTGHSRAGHALATPVASCPFLLGCNDPTEPKRAEPALLAMSRAISSNAACYPVRFHSDDERFGADPTMIIGEFSGDIQG